MTRPIPSTEDLLRLAEASLSNAEALIDDARVLAEAGRFPRAHALATLGCEELGKTRHCLYATWGVLRPKAFWSGFTNHELKLNPAQISSVLKSRESISSERQFSASVRNGSRLDHLRKLHGLYVDFHGGMLEVPDDIGVREALGMVDKAGALLERQKASWSVQVTNVQQLSSLPLWGRLLIIMFVGWVVATHHGVVVSVIRERDWSSVTAELLENFAQQAEEAGDLLAFLTQIADQLS
jgi:AbiV family abortive infection protein